MEVSKRWEYAKKLKLCFRCLGEGYPGQSCFRTRICGLDGCQEVHRRLLHKQTVNINSVVNKNSSDSRKVPQQQVGYNADKSVPQQKKNVDVNQKVKQQVFPVKGRLQIKMRMLQ